MYCMECGKCVGLTLTWDVLKCPKKQIRLLRLTRINFNMGCIEISIRQAKAIEQNKINFNMGCIEITSSRTQKPRIFRLTLTWDVLKLQRSS